MKLVSLSGGLLAQVDDADFDKVRGIRWNVCPKGYAITSRRINGKTETFSMHRLIFGRDAIGNVDHINGDTLDNRRANLRLASRSQNSANSKLREGCSSRFKGVSWRKSHKKWVARICVNYRPFHLGLFDNEISAARAYNAAAKHHFGEFARLNPV